MIKAQLKFKKNVIKVTCKRTGDNNNDNVYLQT